MPYNCVASSLGIKDQWISLGTSLEEYEDLFTEMGYQLSTKSNADIAVFVSNGQFSHVASRSLVNPNIWESKIGSAWDILHQLEELEEGIYGRVQEFWSKVKINE